MTRAEYCVLMGAVAVFAASLGLLFLLILVPAAMRGEPGAGAGLALLAFVYIYTVTITWIYWWVGRKGAKEEVRKRSESEGESP